MLENYLKIAWKVLLRRKFFTFISVFGISFTLLVLMVSAALLDHVFAPHAPETRLDRTLGIYAVEMRGENGVRKGPPGYGFLDRYVRTLPDIERVSLFQTQHKAVSYVGGQKVESFLKRTDGEFWKILDFEFLEGQPFSSRDEAMASHVAVINEATRQRFFNGRPAVGKTIEVDGQKFRVVGVVNNVPATRFIPFSDIWVPISTSKLQEYKSEFVGPFMGIVLARDRADFAQIQAEFQSRLRRVELPDPKTFKTMNGGLETLFDSISRYVFSNDLGEAKPNALRTFLFVVMIVFMLLPTMNLVNINLSRIMERASEIGVRKAFGASSRTLVGQFLVENVVLTLVGGVIGLALSALALAILNRSGLIPYADFGLNLRIFGYGLALALFFGLFSGVYPAWRMSRMRPVEALQGRS